MDPNEFIKTRHTRRRTKTMTETESSDKFTTQIEEKLWLKTKTSLKKTSNKFTNLSRNVKMISEFLFKIVLFTY
jgi:hypothetical protein